VAASLLSARDPLSRRPDPASLLEAAIRERDAATTARLIHHWVHRRGLAALQRFRDDLTITQGAEAGRWLEGLLEAPGIPAPAVAATPPAVSAVPPPSPSPAAPLIATTAAAAKPPIATTPAAVEPLAATVAAAPPAAFSEPLTAAPEAAVAIETLAIETGAPASPAPVAAAAPAPEASPVSASVPVSASAPVASVADPPPALAADWSFDLEAAFPAAVPAGQPAAVRFVDPLAAPASPGLPGPEPTLTDAAAGGEEVQPQPPRRSLSPLARMKALMRDCLDEARGVFQRADHDQDPEDLPLEETDPGVAAAAALEWPAPPSPALSLPPSPNGAAPSRPAPAPTTLSDLRSWLPDAAGDLPKAS
jgi:hypothetical protein